MDRVEEFILQSLRDMHSSSITNRRDGISLETAFNAYVEVDVSGEKTIEVPAVISPHPALDNGYDAIIIPIIATLLPINRKLIRGILADFMNPRLWSRGFVPCRTATGDLYYGMPGLILNSEKEPLLAITMEMVKSPAHPTMRYFVLHRAVCHISPKVFTNSDKIVEKTIIKKVIPFCSTKVLEEQDLLRTSRYRPDLTNIVGTTIKVVIDDYSHLVAKPISPRPSSSSKKDMNKLIVNHIDEILVGQ